MKQSKYCPICKKSARPAMQKLASYWYCNNCRIGWLKQIPDSSYDDTYYVSGSSFLSRLFNPIASLFVTIRELYARDTQKNLWIDVGAGEGSFLAQVHAKKKIGVEISASGRSTMKRKGLSVLTNNEFLKKKQLNADVISFWHVLEHVVDPIDFIRCAERNLRPHGKVIIGVPNVDSLELALFGKYWFHLAPQYHLWFFSPKSLKIMIEEAGLKVDFVDYWAVEHHIAGILQSFINASTHTDNILHKLVRRRQDLSKITVSQLVWRLFWCTFGLPIVIIWWVIAALTKRPGAFVLVASKSASNK